jgi:hypothetical protein
VGSTNQVEVVSLEKRPDNVFSKSEGDAPLVLPPPVNLLVGVGPEQVAEQPGVRHVGGAGKAPDLRGGREEGTKGGSSFKEGRVPALGGPPSIQASVWPVFLVSRCGSLDDKENASRARKGEEKSEKWREGGRKGGRTYLVHVMEFGAQAAMHTENFAINNGSDRETIETIRESLKRRRDGERKEGKEGLGGGGRRGGRRSMHM